MSLLLVALASASDRSPKSALSAQAANRKATTADALVEHPSFYHGQHVIVRSRLDGDEGLAWISAGGGRVYVMSPSRASAPADASWLEIRGIFYDVGRIESGDPRLRTTDLEAVSKAQLNKSWPAPGELLVILAEAQNPAERPLAPSLRAIALEPDRYEDQRVTVTGRFRGRNLYGDLPRSPGKSSWDFVLQSADAAVWITGLRPRGRGFHLKVDARVDTGRWLEVSGIVRAGGGLVWIEASEVTLAEAPVEVPAPQPPQPAQGPAPEVLFSAPTRDETDVSPDSNVRIQFSRDMDPASFKGRVQVSYLDQQAAERGEPQPPALAWTTTYHAGTRVLEIQFSEPLARFRSVKVDLLEGIAALDGAPLPPWTLLFNLGG